jgi:EAL domain-containing protein (putative c-di-GMP-specific phosphodiesterase class I)
VVVGVEALMRWRHPHRGEVGHRECLELAAETGMVLPLGEWLLAAAVGQAKSWHEQFADQAPPLVVNLAQPQATDPDLVGLVRGLLDAGCLAADRLQLAMPVQALIGEITETASGDAQDNLQVLADLGVLTAIHDFGGEHGSLVLMEDLPLRAVQVAPWLVHRLADRPDSLAGRAMADLVSLVHVGGAAVIVPEVHTEEQAGWWHGIGADIACGKQFGLPSPPEAITELLAGPPPQPPAS